MQESREIFQTFTRRFGLLNKNCCSVLDQEVSLVQSHILFEISKHPGSAMQEIADLLGMDITTFSRQIQTLIKRELVLKSPSSEDRRIQLLFLTPLGQQLTDGIDAEMNGHLEDIFKKMTPFEKTAVLQSITLLNDAMLNSDSCCKTIF
ncbi:MarR family winged helix-turn-helix transcriptional regulator [Exiguobacterium artemiae]|uniref:MarR family winged helix-turn-helix transcriptional regulator n=1 Tax=Exiguobacterium artemiae TaxID=340145 RepID=UPI0029651BA5|nr:MarR family winged helix-turn-helix transcriptional regulator [Exiguobacterium sibiricum]MDW2886501.1 MarR family winged helix-turn-helix transcriptional regulator [Exiguobacterium sibiricum]